MLCIYSITDPVHILNVGLDVSEICNNCNNLVKGGQILMDDKQQT